MYMVSFLYKLAPFSVFILFAHEMHHCFLKGQLSASSRNNVPSFGPAKLSVVVIIVKWLGGCYSSERKGWPGRIQASLKSSFSSFIARHLLHELIGWEMLMAGMNALILAMRSHQWPRFGRTFMRSFPPSGTKPRLSLAMEEWRLFGWICGLDLKLLLRCSLLCSPTPSTQMLLSREFFQCLICNFLFGPDWPMLLPANCWN